MTEIYSHFLISRVQVFHSSPSQLKQSWVLAHLFCRRHGANLLSISGPEEEQFVLQVLHEIFGWVWTSKQLTCQDDKDDVTQFLLKCVMGVVDCTLFHFNPSLHIFTCCSLLPSLAVWLGSHIQTTWFGEDNLVWKITQSAFK